MKISLEGYDFFFLTRLFPVIILASLVWFHCCNSVSYDFYCLILCKQTSNIIILKILTAIMQLCNTLPFTKNCRGFFLKLDIFFLIWSCWCSCPRHMHKLSFCRIFILLLRPLSVHALFQNGRFNKDDQKNKQEYINKPKRNAYKD